MMPINNSLVYWGGILTRTTRLSSGSTLNSTRTFETRTLLQALQGGTSSSLHFRDDVPYIEDHCRNIMENYMTQFFMKGRLLQLTEWGKFRRMKGLLNNWPTRKLNTLLLIGRGHQFLLLMLSRTHVSSGTVCRAPAWCHVLKVLHFLLLLYLLYLLLHLLG